MIGFPSLVLMMGEVNISAITSSMARKIQGLNSSNRVITTERSVIDLKESDSIQLQSINLSMCLEMNQMKKMDTTQSQVKY